MFHGITGVRIVLLTKDCNICTNGAVGSFIPFRSFFPYLYYFFVSLFRRALTFLENSGTVSQPLLMERSTNHRTIFTIGLGLSE